MRVQLVTHCGICPFAVSPTYESGDNRWMCDGHNYAGLEGGTLREIPSETNLCPLRDEPRLIVSQEHLSG